MTPPRQSGNGSLEEVSTVAIATDDVENVEVNVILYDDGDTELFDFNDTVEREDEVQKLLPGRIWEFQVVFDDMGKIARYKVTANPELV